MAGRYLIEGQLGRGGIGVVYRAVQLPLARPVAVKVLHDDMLSLAELRARFEREARVLSALTHPHVVGITDYGIDEDQPFLVMELLDGETLEDALARGPMRPDRALSLARQMLRGLAFAHEKGVAHRDLKPANVFLQRMPDGSEHLKLLDFGLARMLDPEEEAIDAPTLTHRGVVFGTPAYMSPEQAAGAPVDERSDVYSAALLCFELLAGRRPFIGATRADLLKAHLSTDPPRLREVRPELKVSRELEAWLRMGMAKEPDDRHPDARDMLAALDALEPPLARLVDPLLEANAPRRRWRPALLAVLGLVGALLLAFLVSQSLRDEIVAEIEAPEGAEASPSDLASFDAPLPPDPFESAPPEPLRPFLAQARAGYAFGDRAEVRPLYALAREMPRDPRPLLLLGHLFFHKGWYTESIRRYETAHRIEPAARGDRLMLRHLIAMAARESVSERAAELLLEAYGEEARPALEEAIEARRSTPLEQLRLVRLRERL